MDKNLHKNLSSTLLITIMSNYTHEFYDFLSDMTVTYFFFFYIDDSHGILSLNFHENEESYHKYWHLLNVLLRFVQDLLSNQLILL